MPRHVILVTLLALSLPAAARASTAGPRQGRERERQRDKRSQRPELTLTLTVAGIFSPAGPDSRDLFKRSGVHAHLGTDLYFHEGRTGFVGGGAELQYLPLPSDGAWGLSVTPTLRAGVALVGDNNLAVLLRRIPVLKLYAIAGWRLPNAAQAGALRVGLGVSCFLVTALLQGAPGTAEVVLDTDFDTTSYHLRLGWGL